jgi:membrane-bound ClpP family serine protease
MLEGIITGISFFSLILLLTGFVLIGIELILPGISFPGVTGGICLITCIFLMADNIVEGAIITVVILVLLAIMMGIMLYLFSSGKLVRPMVLNEEQHRHTGYMSGTDLTYLLGKEGVALTDLRPTGVGCFEGKSIDVLSSGPYILRGSVIKVEMVHGNKVVVKAIEKV